MSSVAAPVASVKRRLSLRRRPDLEVQPLSLWGHGYQVVKDPLSLRYFHLRDEEYWVLEQLDGMISLAEIQARFAARFSPRRLSTRELQSFLARLHEEGLALSDAPDQGTELQNRAARERRRRFWQTLSNPLAIRFRGVDPERFLGWLYPKVHWFFSRWFLAGCGIVVLAALTLAIVRFESLRARLPELSSFLSLSNVFWLAATLAGVKVLHELGHALACRHFGGECHELGVMFLVFTPCLYCNVSDAWMFPSKWRRAAVGAAGIAVELILAAISTFLWWSTQPGLLNALCLDVMVVCSISTLVFNGNPLLRYDGYYVLADLVEVPNLAQRAQSVIREALARWFLEIDLPGDEDLSAGRRVFLATYAVASTIYRWVVLFGVLWFVYRTLERWQMEVVAEGLAVFVLAGILARPLWHAAKFALNPVWRSQMNVKRAFAGALLVAGTVATTVFLPLPHRIKVPAVLEPQDARRIYVSVAGTLERSVDEGKAVSAGDTLAVLSSPDLAMEIERLRGQRDRQELHVENLKRRQGGDADAAAQIPAAEEALADLEERLRQRLVDEQRLTLVAPIAGTVLPPHRKLPAQKSGDLGPWSGTPIDPENLGSFLETGTQYCLIGDPGRLEAVLVIDQSDVEFIRPGQPVEIQMKQLPGTILRGAVGEVAQIDLKVTPPELLPLGIIPTQADEQGVPRPVGAVYQARVSFNAEGRQLLAGETGEAKIFAEPRSLARRLARVISRTMRFEL